MHSIKQKENVTGTTDMFRFRFVVQIFIRTQYLHFPASCSSKKTKARKNKGEINAELKQTGFCFCFFQHQAGYVMRRIRRETLQIGDWISFQSVHPHQLMHVFLYASSASENWIMEVFWNVLLLPSEINIYIYIYIYTVYTVYIYRYIYIYIHIYTCFHPPRTHLFISFGLFISRGLAALPIFAVGMHY